MTVEQPPEDRPFQAPRRQRPEEPRQTNMAMVALIAFAFGVFLHGCVALSILDSGGGGSGSTESSLPTPEPQVTVGVAAENTATPLPDRTSCSEIQGTQYRSATERQFYLANCLATATPVPSTTPTATPAP